MVKKDWERMCSIGDVLKQRTLGWFEAERFVPDGTAGATFTDQSGTAGQFQYNSLYFTGAADALVYLNFEIPRDYYDDLAIDLWWYTNSTTGTAVSWAGRVRYVNSTEATTVSYTGTPVASQRVAGRRTANNMRKTTLDLTQTTSSTSIAIDANDFCNLRLFRNVSEDGNANRVYLVGAEVYYTGGG